MLEKDYILRLLNQFFDDLNQFINKKTTENKRKEIIPIFNTFVGSYTFYHTSTIDTILKSFEIYSMDERIYRIEMLAELYYQEALLEQEYSIKATLWEYSLILMEYIDIHSNTYSFDRKRKINFIKNKIQK